MNPPYSYRNLGKNRAMVVEQVAGTGKLLKNRVLTTDKLQEIRTDNNEDGITDLYEVRSGSYVVRATHPYGGSFHKLEIEDRYKKGTLTSTLWLKGSKYVLTRTKYEPRTTYRAAEDIAVGGTCSQDWGQQAFDDLKWVIDRAVEETGKSRSEALKCRLKQLSEVLIDKSCREKTFSNLETNNEMIESMSSILDSSMNGKGEYLGCLEKNRLGTHSARIQGSLARQIMEAEGALSLALSSADFAEVQKSCEPASVTLKRLGKSMPTRISAQPKFKCEYVADRDWRGSYDDRTNPGQVVMRKTSAYLGSYFKPANKSCTAHQGTASTLFHELLHDSKIKDEDFAEELELCCSPGIAIEGTRKSNCGLVSNRTDKIATAQAMVMLLNSRSSSYHEAVKEVDRQFGKKSDEMMEAYHNSLSENLNERVKQLEAEIKKCPDEACKREKASQFEEQLLDRTKSFFARRGGCEAQKKVSGRASSIDCRALGDRFANMIRDMDSKVATQRHAEKEESHGHVTAASSESSSGYDAAKNREASSQRASTGEVAQGSPSSQQARDRRWAEPPASIVTVNPDSISKIPVTGTNGMELPEIAVDPTQSPEAGRVLAMGSADASVGLVDLDQVPPTTTNSGSSLDLFNDFYSYGTSTTDQSSASTSTSTSPSASSTKRYYDFRTGQWVQGTSNFRYYSDSITQTEEASNLYEPIQAPPASTTLPGPRVGGNNPKSGYVPTYTAPPSEPNYFNSQPSSGGSSSRPTGYVGTSPNTSRPTGYAGTPTEVSRNDSYSSESENSNFESSSENSNAPVAPGYTAPSSTGSSQSVSSRVNTRDISLAEELRERRNVASDMERAEQQYMRDPTAMPQPGQESGRDVQSSTALVSLARAAASAVSDPLTRGLNLVKENVDLDLIPQAAASTFQEGSAKNRVGSGGQVVHASRGSLGGSSDSDTEEKARASRPGQMRSVASSTFGSSGGGSGQSNSSSSGGGIQSRAASEFEGASGKQAETSDQKETKTAKASGGVRPDRGVTTDGREKGGEDKSSDEKDSNKVEDDLASNDQARLLAQADAIGERGRSNIVSGRSTIARPTNYVGAVAWISDNYEQARRESRQQESQYVQWQMRVRFVLPNGKYEDVGSTKPRPQRDFKACPIRGTGKAKLVNIRDSCP